VLDCTSVIDHIDGNASNNRIENLRSVTMKENGRNKQRACNNDTGFAGVYERHVFVANWTINEKQYSKAFSVYKHGSAEAAKQAAIDYRVKKLEELNLLGYGYTERHIFN
jgi:hypothetical protein